MKHYNLTDQREFCHIVRFLLEFHIYCQKQQCLPAFRSTHNNECLYGGLRIVKNIGSNIKRKRMCKMPGGVVRGRKMIHLCEDLI